MKTKRWSRFREQPRAEAAPRCFQRVHPVSDVAIGPDIVSVLENMALDMIASNTKPHGLIGTWKLISNRIMMEDTGEELDLFGTNPRGVITFAPNGRMTAILTTAERPAPVSDADFRAIVMGMSAYAGRFTIQDDHVLIDPDVAWVPFQRQIRYFELDGDRLTLRTPLQEIPIHPGRLIRNTIVWERET